ncbi:TetR/AcrR family transcriptional regulator [Caulobacter vibrioides]|uniref:Transcriptional regulator, TetR family n=2 Tax=Caulobacter vibrioides TaxID=155892 RepID=Q9AB97_CAUVC|nr:transcriptional regulator, TetR family [Caulobacter vibrioides CB15]ATC23335.1 TetR/AcrR family transcriptional regulator [Caulobacter vibrioides]ATC27163.1 TetR/AcrR family transcriptional regulator [Caulobacter vibrioides]AZH11548.1 TetR/AcrR family transcriptional regulator [Caulobacter vibrioides]PLR12992.1 TetR/AcrR family transcriptional regulator [Caulobacter vibrioides]
MPGPPGCAYPRAELHQGGPVPMTATKSRARAGGRGRPSKAKGLDLKETILDAAEGLFARHGFYGVTTRQVAAEAGVDTALIHYYFGAKRELFDAVFLRRAEILNQAREASMNAYVKANAGAMTVEGVIEAFIDPLLRISQDGGRGWKSYFVLVAQVNNTPAWGGETMTRFFDPVVHQLVETLKTVRPEAAYRDLYWCYQFLTGSMMLTLSETGRIDSLSEGECHSSDLESVRQRLFAYCAAGFEAVIAKQNKALASG